MTRTLGLSLGVLALLTAAGTSPRAMGDATEGALPANLDSPSLARARIALELRRAGGGRPTIVKNLLSRARACDPEAWGLTVLELCQGAAVSCLEFQEAVEKWAADQPPDSRPWAEHVRKEVDLEAQLESLSPLSRRAALCKAVAVKPPTNGRLVLTPADAARRLLRDGNWDLTPLVDSASATWPRSERGAVAPFVLFAKTMQQGGKSQHLVALVRQAAQSEIGHVKNFHGQFPTNDPLIQAAKLALERLRATRAVDTLPLLMEIVNGYPVVADHSEPSAAINKSSASSSARQGVLPRSIGMLIGDLGDRSTERRIVGEAILWDRVQQAETILLRRGQLQPSELVALQQ